MLYVVMLNVMAPTSYSVVNYDTQNNVTLNIEFLLLMVSVVMLIVIMLYAKCIVSVIMLYSMLLC